MLDLFSTNLIESMIYTGITGSAVVIDRSDLVLMYSGVRSPDMNGVYQRGRLSKNTDKSIFDAISFYSQKNIPFFWWVQDRDLNRGTLKSMRDHGLRKATEMPIMVKNLADYTDNSEHCGKCKTVTTKPELEDWIRLSSLCIELDPAVFEEYRRNWLLFDLADTVHQELFIAYEDGIPCASALVYKSREMAGIYFVATDPEFRNRGFGLEITRYALKSAKLDGIPYAGLQASSMGLGMYLKIGFQIIGMQSIFSLIDRSIRFG
jgi:GNAT superfamily N-acetyltransferase